eukprot:CAMPEP_0197714192 /NCGR_PEP_ID=MMETSP1338-20131121/130839_1 /TAXON_ID=43686 ORGANISM="Pelagodinium beii, Strain RCC1491" /NCGR_SAMPLE_ID=MMETSP1338 /ASSEMBLY_ACC=CAM_ASM_000754 /LENGTH=45 /DNA_ID= /DNA_START= /DNA_END= /DNA_ORIENTATION=
MRVRTDASVRDTATSEHAWAISRTSRHIRASASSITWSDASTWMR